MPIKRMCHDEIKEAVRKVIDGSDDVIAAIALRELAHEIAPDDDEMTEGFVTSDN
ncbi:MAG: hypothetical protein HQL42_13255 [Alphaproteobacteria bacterium]|nr:hypothetical protein [Alphaproteobacteria bacterium]